MPYTPVPRTRVTKRLVWRDLEIELHGVTYFLHCTAEVEQKQAPDGPYLACTPSDVDILSVHDSDGLPLLNPPTADLQDKVVELALDY